MQRDTGKSFGEIHESIESLAFEVEHIIDVALVRANDDGSLKLRFIKLVGASDTKTSDQPVADCLLTTPEDHTPGLEYVAVSYCWKHQQSSQGLKIPEYRLWDTSTASRSPKCPPLVLHRALQFAQQVKCPYVWIDQECIDQDDAVDIERHLKVMHRIYRASTWTVAVLSHTISDVHSVEALSEIFHPQGPRFNYDDEAAKFNVALMSLMHITDDRWFTRTWTFQEKECATDLHLLVPIDRNLDIPDPDTTSSLNSRSDLCLSMERVTEILIGIRRGHFGPNLEEMIEKRDWLFQEDLDHLGIWYGRIGRSIYDNASSTWQQDNHLLHGAFQMMEKCDNLVTADRISIFGNVCRLPRRLLSNRLNRKKFSYSTCLLALLLANFYPDQQDRAAVIVNRAWLLQNHTIATLIEDESFHFSDESFHLSDKERTVLKREEDRLSDSGKRLHGTALFLILAIVSLPFLHVALHLTS